MDTYCVLVSWFNVALNRLPYTDRILSTVDIGPGRKPSLVFLIRLVLIAK
jgi:hypothetical protein